MNWNVIKKNYESYTRIILAFLIAVACVRIYEHHAVADRSLLSHPILFELGGLVFDTWAVLIYGIILAPIFLVFMLLNKKIGQIILHVLNLLFLSAYIGLIMTFSERNNPFDHELFNREAFEIWDTIKQMITRGVAVFLPFVFSYFIYWIAYISLLKKIIFKKYYKKNEKKLRKIELIIILLILTLYSKMKLIIKELKNSIFLMCMKMEILL